MFSDLNVFVGWQNGGKDKNLAIDPFHVYVNEVELEDKTITRSDV